MVKFLIFLLTSIVIPNIYAEDLIRNASPDELIESLDPNSTKNLNQVTTRGLRNLSPEERKSPSVNLVIQFEFNSSTLLNQSKPLLDNLTKAMNSDQLKSSSFIIEGHTDDVGSKTYNLKLSEQRANSVLRYFVMNGVKKERLKSAGKGSSELLLPDKPDAPENRRVKISLY
jgi:outer membrane protein OmpA-like peptidoglycan-associated protein